MSSTPPNIPAPGDTSLCPFCNYDIRGLNFVEDKATCPECGAALDRILILRSERYKDPSIIRLLKIPVICSGMSVLVLLVVGITAAGFVPTSWKMRDFRSAINAAVIIGSILVSLVTPPIIYWRENRRRFHASRASRGKVIRVGIVFCAGCSALVIMWSTLIQLLVVFAFLN